MSDCDVKEFKLCELLKIYNGTKYDHLNKGDIPLYGSGGLMSHVDEALYSGEAILLPRKGTLSNIMYVNESFWTVDTMYYAVVNDKLADAFYLYSYLSQLDLSNLDSGSTLPSMTKSAYESIVVKLPDLKIQKAVATILFNIRKKLETNNKINQELEAMAKTLYDYWFVQFDFPDQNAKPYKSSGGKMVYNPELKREIPEGWGVEKLGDISQYVTEKVDSFELNIENYVGTDNMIADMGGIEFTTSIPKSGTSTKFSVGDILISNIRPYFKKIWLSDRTGGCSADVLCIRTNRIIPKEFVYATLARDDFFNYDVAGSKGSKMPRGDKKHIMEYPIVFEFEIVEQYSEIVKPIYEAVHKNNNQNQELTQLRDWLLPMLMNGQVKVE
ncbi:restriction endonuclease subunit S [Streptococcus thermophilus]|uniref:restriction endonuclease subunit S n=1 Tax=Streptococcus thermophilus TaxID=1308 RepID=UPI0011095B5D|nr:restriction endonuclease subunit S [Streptococcus thermophilus]MBO1147163.1 restriction endonuclease subunit S [Streptococcus thermophilus]MBO1149964.1 restriction endonuclease subunit S [Streptococcus thermophilus]MBO1151582.1 restriction endonuclease subunit S [Streptococcus thermophilus]MBO1153195.1 restriction endonuclease subunit S [Streptococcus thermophilus]MBO1155322.1 restriction endonuclease subunit S [Streptococcus thermophilus]